MSTLSPVEAPASSGATTSARTTADPSHDLSTDLRLACLRIARRNRFESEVEVPPHQFAILAHIQRGPVTAGELCDLERVSAPTISRAVNQVVESGWVERTDDPNDGRRVILTLTDAGRAVVEQTRRARDEWMAARLAQLTETERAELAAALPILERIASS